MTSGPHFNQPASGSPMDNVLRRADDMRHLQSAFHGTPVQPARPRPQRPASDVVALLKTFARWAVDNNLPTTWVGARPGWLRQRPKGWQFIITAPNPKRQPDNDLQHGIPWSNWSPEITTASITVTTEGTVHHYGQVAEFSVPHLEESMADLINRLRGGR